MNRKDKNTAIILAFFLGGIGGHKFYLGRSGAGVLYLIFCWTFIPAFMAIIDLLVLAFMDQVRFDQLYNPHLLQQAPMPVVAYAPPPPPPPQNLVVNVQNSAASSGGPDMISQLKSLHELHQAGALTADEFAAQKQRLLTGTRG